MSGKVTPRRLFRLLLVAAAVLFAGAAAAQVSPEYLGTFVLPPEQQGDPMSCGRENNDGAMAISARSVEYFEYQCDVTAFRFVKIDPRSAEVRLSCAGEGNKWRTREVWNLQRVESRTMLVVTRLQVADTQMNGKRLPGKMRDEVRISLYAKCPAPSSR